MMRGKNINLTINNKRILCDINFDIAAHKITCFLGHNGSGKTTLLRCLVNLQKKYTGSIFYGNRNIKRIPNCQQAQNINFVFQNFNLFNNLTILQNCALPISHVLKTPIEQAQTIIMPLLERLNIDTIKDYYPSKLSHGQKQKAAIARALSFNPKILILDEPTASLDDESKQSLVNLLLDLQNQGISIVLTSHDKLFTDSLVDRVYHIENGRIVAYYEKK